ncbi:hypothetical protein [Rhodoferax sp. GW822-FHT02A01]|uniref:hypothetical protein n=1 Tax=Rhodoferax sp. GW822-FHT02A01 TaxID=3141537 RepID=UPI00315D24AF
MFDTTVFETLYDLRMQAFGREPVITWPALGQRYASRGLPPRNAQQRIRFNQPTQLFYFEGLFEMEDIDVSQQQDLNPKATVVLWGIAAMAFAALAAYAMFVNPKYNFGFFSAVLCFIVTTIGGTIGALIGNALCNFARPTAVWTTGGFFSLLWIKIFWRIGPQVIGLIVVGAACGGMLIPYLKNPVPYPNAQRTDAPANFNPSISDQAPANVSGSGAQAASQPAPLPTPAPTGKLSAAAEKAISEGFVEIKDPKVEACTDARIEAIRKERGEDALIDFGTYNEAAVKCGFNL